MWRTRKRLTTDTAAGEPDSERTPATLPNPNRNAYILMGIGGGVLAVFGLAAIAGIFAPVFFAFVLTICAHPLRLALEKRGVPRGLATGSVIAVVMTLLLIGFGYALLVAIGRFGVLLNDYSDDLEAAGQAFATWLTTIGISSEEIQPRIIGKAVSLSQAITFFSVLFWAVVVDPIGAILAMLLTLLVRLLLVDTNTSMTWIRPILGDVTETKQIMAESDAAAKAARAARKVGAAGRED